jgi:copper chaperone CopZ
VQQHLGRLDGVAKVEVSLSDGKAVITPKEDGRIDPAQVVRATFDSGVTIAEMQITATGKLRNDPANGWVFEINPAQAYLVAIGPLLQALENNAEPVKLTGILYRKPEKKPKKNEPPVFRLEILAVEKK